MKWKILHFLLLNFLVLVSIGITLAAIEYGLRRYTHEQTGKVLFIPHPTAFVTLAPDIEKVINEGTKLQFSVKTNEIGVRDDRPLCKNADVLLFGDSNLFAQFLPFRLTLGKQLEKLYGNSICSVNFGVPGYGPDQSLLRMEYELNRLNLKPRIIVFHIFADNDYGDLFRNNLFKTDGQGKLKSTGRTKPDFKLGWLEQLQARSLIGRRIRDLAYKNGYYKMSDNEYIPDRSRAYLNSRPTTQKRMNNFISHVDNITRNEFSRYKQGRYTTWLGDIYDYSIALAPESEAAKTAENLMAAIIKQARQKSHDVNSCFVVLIEPSEWDVSTTGPVTYRDMERYSKIFDRSYNRNNLVNIAMRAAIKSNASYINLFDLYSEPGAHAYNPVYVDHGDNHWNTNGIEIAARALRTFIEKNNCLGGRHPANQNME